MNKVSNVDYAIENLESLVGSLNDLSNSYSRVLNCENLTGDRLKEELFSVNLTYNNALGVIGRSKNVISIESIGMMPSMNIALTREGILDGITGIFKKIWEFIKKMFKAIKDFIFGTAEDKLNEEKKEVREETKKIIDYMREREFKDKETVIKILDKQNYLVNNGKYGILSLLLKRFDTNIRFKDVLGSIKYYYEYVKNTKKQADEVEFFKELEKSNEQQVEIIGKVTVMALNTALNMSIVMSDSKLIELFSKFKDGIDYNFNNNQDLGYFEEKFIINKGDETIKLLDSSKNELLYVSPNVMMTCLIGKLKKDIVQSIVKESSKLYHNAKDDDSLSESSSVNMMVRDATKVSFSNSVKIERRDYKIKDKEIDNIKSKLNKEFIINFITEYSRFIDEINPNEFTALNKEVVEIEKMFEVQLDKLIKASKKSTTFFALSQAAKNRNNINNMLVDISNILKQYLFYIRDITKIAEAEIELVTKAAKFENVAKTLQFLFKDKEGSISSESFNSNIKKSSLTFATKKSEENKEEPKPRKKVIVNFTKIVE